MTLFRMVIESIGSIGVTMSSKLTGDRRISTREIGVGEFQKSGQLSEMYNHCDDTIPI